jgi:hypothetical protein
MTYNPMTEALDYVLWLTGDGIELDDALTKAADRLHVDRTELAAAFARQYVERAAQFRAAV